MNLKSLAQDFYESYGYYPDSQTLQAYIEELGYSDYNPYSDVSDRSGKTRNLYEVINIEEEQPDDIITEFKGLLSDLKRNARSYGKEGNKTFFNDELISELGFMSLTFFTKAVLYFLIRYGHKKNYLTDL